MIDRTAQAVFDKAIYLIDAQNERTGSTDTSDTREYKVRALGIINTLLDEVYPVSDTYELNTPGQRPALDDLVAFESEIDLDAFCLRTVLPNGLAAELLSEENPSLANYFREKYEQALARARAGIPAEFEEVDGGAWDALYGGIEYGEFSRW